jgi:hypothetical protein
MRIFCKFSFDITTKLFYLVLLGFVRTFILIQSFDFFSHAIKRPYPRVLRLLGSNKQPCILDYFICDFGIISFYIRFYVNYTIF